MSPIVSKRPRAPRNRGCHGPGSRTLFLTCLVAALVPLVFRWGVAEAQTSHPIDVEHADVLAGRSEGGVSLRELSGNVVIRHDNVRIACDRAVQNLTGNSVELLGHVVITQDTLVLETERGTYTGDDRIASSTSGIRLRDGHVALSAQSGRYNAATRIAHFATRVHVEDSTARIDAPELIYYRDSSRAVAIGPTVVRFTRQNAVVTGDSVIHYTKTRLSFVPLHPRLWQIDTVTVRRDSVTGRADSIRLDTTYISATYMEARRDSSDLFLARDDVAIVRRSLAARCREATFFGRDSLIVLRGSPIVWQEESQVRGDSIAVYLSDNTVSSMNVTGDAFSVSRSRPTEQDSIYVPGRFDQATGRRMLLGFDAGKLSGVRMESSAISLYYLYDGRALNGVRRESGDTIVVRVQDGRVHDIRTIGGVEGTYYPEKYVHGNEATFNLAGFAWREDRPTMHRYPDLRTAASGREILTPSP